MNTNPAIRIVPLGGLGEIGMNCLALEVGGEILVVDCGVTFPKSDLGIETFHPDFSWLEERRDRVRGLVITHGHEDHIGAIPYFADRFEVPIWGPQYALQLIRLRLDEYGYRPNEVELIPSEPRKRFAVGGFEVEPIRVTHSITEATALVMRTRAGTVVHTGDFKLDAAPSDGELTDEERFAEVGDEGVRLLFSDSTNVDTHGHTGSEAVAAVELARLLEHFHGRVVVGMFASNVQRLKSLGELAMRHGRKLVLLGRSVLTHVRVAQERGRLSFPSDLVVPLEQARSMPRRELLVLATGTQAERLAAMWRIAHRTHPHFSLDAGDRVVFSSRTIPGNEPAVTLMINGLLRQGVDVRTPLTDPGIHVSGHAYRDEQTRMIELVRPSGFVPVHGTLAHLHRHADLARSLGVREVLVLENGDVADAGVDGGLTKADEGAPFGRVPTWNGEEIPEQVIADREAIARAGIALVTVLVDGRGRPAGPAQVATRGVLDETIDASVVRDAAREVTKALHDRSHTRDRPTDEDLAETARLAARRRLEQAVGKKPVVLANVIRLKA